MTALSGRPPEGACAEAESWWLAGHDVSVSVNVGAGQLTQIAEFERAVCAALTSTGLPPDLLVCEITEPELLEVDQRTVAGVKRLRALGVQLSVDDFGTGYASVNHLLVLAVQEVKVDRPWCPGLAPTRLRRQSSEPSRVWPVTSRCVALPRVSKTKRRMRWRCGSVPTAGRATSNSRPVPASALRSTLTPV